MMGWLRKTVQRGVQDGFQAEHERRRREQTSGSDVEAMAIAYRRISAGETDDRSEQIYRLILDSEPQDGMRKVARLVAYLMVRNVDLSRELLVMDKRLRRKAPEAWEERVRRLDAILAKHGEKINRLMGEHDGS